MMIDKIAFKNFMCLLRSNLGLNQKEFASELGISRPYVSLMETGSRSPSLKILFLLRKKYGFSIDQMLDIVDERTIPD